MCVYIYIKIYKKKKVGTYELYSKCPDTHPFKIRLFLVIYFSIKESTPLKGEHLPAWDLE